MTIYFYISRSHFLAQAGSAARQPPGRLSLPARAAMSSIQEQAVGEAVEAGQTELHMFVKTVQSLTEQLQRFGEKVNPVSTETIEALQQSSGSLAQTAQTLAWQPASKPEEKLQTVFQAEITSDEQGTLQAELSLADYARCLRSLTGQELSVEAVCQLRRQTDKLRQIEKAIHFVERRQDAAVSLPSELVRHYHQCKLDAIATEQPQQAAHARQHWKTARRDAAFVGFQGGCLTGCLRAIWLYGCLTL